MGENIWWVTLNNSIIISNSNGSLHFLKHNLILTLMLLFSRISLSEHCKNKCKSTPKGMTAQLQSLFAYTYTYFYI